MAAVPDAVADRNWRSPPARGVGRFVQVVVSSRGVSVHEVRNRAVRRERHVVLVEGESGLEKFAAGRSSADLLWWRRRRTRHSWDWKAAGSAGKETRTGREVLIRKLVVRMLRLVRLAWSFVRLPRRRMWSLSAPTGSSVRSGCRIRRRRRCRTRSFPSRSGRKR